MPRITTTGSDVIRSLGLPEDEALLHHHPGSRKRRAGYPGTDRLGVAEAFRQVGEHLGMRLGTHSMRKTRGYHLLQSGISIELISRMLNHSSPSVTMRYIGITQENIDQTYVELVL